MFHYWFCLKVYNIYNNWKCLLDVNQRQFYIADVRVVLCSTYSIEKGTKNHTVEKRQWHVVYHPMVYVSSCALVIPEYIYIYMEELPFFVPTKVTWTQSTRLNYPQRKRSLMALVHRKKKKKSLWSVVWMIGACQI